MLMAIWVLEKTEICSYCRQIALLVPKTAIFWFFLLSVYWLERQLDKMSFRNVQISYEYIWSLPHEMEAPIATFGLTEYKIQRFRAVERFCPDLVLMKTYRTNHKYERKKTSDRRRVKNIWTNNILWSAFSILWKARVQFSHNLSIIRIRELLKDFQQCLLSPEGGCKHEETPIAHSANQTKPRIWQKKKGFVVIGCWTVHWCLRRLKRGKLQCKSTLNNKENGMFTDDRTHWN